VIHVTIYSTWGHSIFLFFEKKRIYGSPPVAMRSEAWVCVPLVAGIAVSNTVEGVDVAC